MANKDNPRGANIKDTLISAGFNEKIHTYIIEASDTNDFFINDFVKTTGDAIGGIPVVTRPVPSETLRGIIVSFGPTFPTSDTPYHKAGTQQLVYICDDPLVEFEIQANGLVGTAQYGQYADIDFGAGDAFNGISRDQIDSSAIQPTSAQLLILRATEEPLNNPSGSNAKFMCMIHKHDFANVIVFATDHAVLANLAYDDANHGTGYTGFQRGTTLSSSSPTVNDDSTQGYVNGDLWLNTTTPLSWICTDNTATNAVWKPLNYNDHFLLDNLTYNNAGHGNGYNGFQRGTTLSSSDPNYNNDESQGYVKGDLWLNTNTTRHFICTEETIGAAVWLINGLNDHDLLNNLTYDTAGHGTGKTGFQRGTTVQTADPTINDDDTEGYVPGDLWLNIVTDKPLMCVDNSTGAAVWEQININSHPLLFNLTYDTAGHGTGKTGFQRGTTLSASNPTVNDDSSQGYVKGDLWFNTATSRHYICIDTTVGAAVWPENVLNDHALLQSLTYATSGHGTGKTGFQRGTTVDTTDPIATDDVNAGYVKGDLWINSTTPESFICTDTSAGAAVWKTVNYNDHTTLDNLTYDTAGHGNGFSGFLRGTTLSGADPTVNADNTLGYVQGDLWLNTATPRTFVVTDVTTGAAVWRPINYDDHSTLLNLTYDTAGHGTGKTGFLRGTTLAAGDPTINDDSTQGYVKGDFWQNTITDNTFVIIDTTVAGAIWKQINYNDHAILDNLAYDDANHGSGYTGFQRGTTLDTSDPTANDDASLGYVPGDLWLNESTPRTFVCTDNTTTAAVWQPINYNDHSTLLNLAYDDANHGSGKTGFQRGTTLNAADPTVNDDSTQGYVQGDLWLNTTTPRTFVVTDVSVGAAVWQPLNYNDHSTLLNLAYDDAGHGTGKTGFQRGTTLSASDPTVNDDSTEGYVKGDLWLNTTSDESWVCTDESVGAAVWSKFSENVWTRTGTTITVTNAGDDIDLSTAGIMIDSVSSVFDVVAATGITPVEDIVIVIQSSTAGDTNITADPQIVAGSEGQRLTLIGNDDTKTVTLDNGTGLKLNNGLLFTIGKDDIIEFIYHGSFWLERNRSDN